jgi:hypothetical protein
MSKYGRRWEAIRQAERPLEQERAAIKAAHPIHTGRHDLYATAMRLVGERHEKGDLVELVNYLLARLDKAEVLR